MMLSAFFMIFLAPGLVQESRAQVCCPGFVLQDAVEICPPEGACPGGTGNPVGVPGHTAAACKLTYHKYTVYPNIPGYTYTWTISGGTPVTATGNPVNILWGSGGTGTIKVVISNLAIGGTCVDSLRQDVCLLDGPQANFTLSNDTVCVGTPVIFTNTSLGGSDYLWDFGDGTISTDAVPSPHVYSVPGTYTVTLTAFSSSGGQGSAGDQKRLCGCQDTIVRTVVVLPGAGPVISTDCCYGTVCPGDTTSVCTPTVCTTYNWSVTGGTIVSGAGTSCIKVVWNAAYSGPTTITLSTPGCLSAPCPGSTTIQVPVLYPNLPISGPNPVCVGSSSSFFLPHLPGTYYQWSTNAPPGTYSFNDKDQNVAQVNITFSVPGTYQIQCQYQNPLAGCSGVSVFTIDVLPVFSFTGDEVVCEGSATTYIANGNASWAVSPAGAIVPPGISPTKSITWNVPGTYVITATNTTPGVFCNTTATKVVEVKARPVLGPVTGPVMVCPGKNYTYKVTSNTQGSFFVWSVTGGTGTVMTMMGADRDSAIIKLTTGPWVISVFQQIEISPGVFCQSLPQTLSVSAFPAPVISGPTTVCVDAITTFTASGPLPTGGIQWSISPSNRGSILSGQGTNSVNIRWHGPATTATITASHCGGSGVYTVNIINPPAVGNITASGPTEYCLPSMPNNLMLSITGGFPSYQWSLNNSPIAGATNSSYLIPNATFTGAGIYYFSVAVSNGSCTVTKTTYVLIGNCSGGGPPPNPVVCTVDFNINPNPACQNQPVTFTALPTGPGFAFSWNFGDGSTSFQTPTEHAYTSPGVYNVTLTATLGTCVATKVKSVTVNPSPVVSISASDTIFCPGGSVTLTASSGMSSYQWYREGSAISGATAMTYVVTRHGEYEVEVTNSFGCPKKSDPLYIYMHGIPKADISGDKRVCAYPGGFSAVSLSAFYDANYTYDWSSIPAGATFSPNNSNSSFQTTAFVTAPMVLPASVEFVLKVTDGVTGCENFDTLCVWFYEYPNVTLPFHSGCEGPSVTLTPSPVDTSKYTYQWSNGATTPSVTVSAAGLYSLVVTDKMSGCATTLYGANIYAKPDLGLFPRGCKTIGCKTDTLNMYIPLPLSAYAPFNTYPMAYPTITWYSNGNYMSPIGTGQSFQFVAPVAGTHQISVVVTNAFGCTDTAGVYCITVVCNELDWGDAPDMPGGMYNYPTLMSSNGARHTVSPNIFLGALIDLEGNGQPNLMSTGDDLAGVDDEDGVIIPPVVVQGSTVNITVTASSAGFLDAWFDFNIDGDWADPGEHIFINQPVVSGPNPLSFTVPVTSNTGQSYTRFRYRTTTAPISYDGLVANGEVEDYAVYLEPGPQYEMDFGDAPDMPTSGFNYPTWLASNGARHIWSPNLFLGSLIDVEPDGQPNIVASGDDLNNLDDEDGVNIPTVLMIGATYNINVVASANGFLDAWIDFNVDGDWADAGEHIFINQPVLSGGNTLSFTVPSGSVVGQSYSRFRYRSSSAPISYNGLAADGEVEDYPVYLEECVHGDEMDFGDAPNNPQVGYNYPTLTAFNGARHYMFGNIRLGALIDDEINGQPNIPSTGDDLANMDDEDGVTFVGKMYVGKPANVTVTASINGFLNAWMDFNQDGDWADAGEQIFTNTALVAGANALTFNIPATAVQGKTYMRFRFNTIGGVPYFGLATDGEVEDYRVHACPNWWPVITPLKHTILIPNNLLNLNPGDVLGVFYTNSNGMEVNAGIVEWDGTNTQVMIAYGDNPNTPEKDGFIVGEPIIWRLCSFIKGDANHIEVTYDPTYPSHNGLFAIGGFSSLAGIQGLHVNITAAPDMICSGEEVQLSAVVAEGAAGVTFEWSSIPTGFNSFEQNPSAWPMSNTTYILHSTDGVFHDYDTVVVTVTEVSPLVEVLPLRNINVPEGVFRCYNATMRIMTAGNGSSFTVQNGGSAQLIAGMQINLMPGTKVLPGGYLRAKISLDGSYCCPTTPAPSYQQVATVFDQPENDGLFRIYPNPTSGIFTIEMKDFTALTYTTIEIFDMVGSSVKSAKLPASDKFIFDLSDKAPGVYLVRVTNGDRTGFGKIIKR